MHPSDTRCLNFFFSHENLAEVLAGKRREVSNSLATFVLATNWEPAENQRRNLKRTGNIRSSRDQNAVLCSCFKSKYGMCQQASDVTNPRHGLTPASAPHKASNGRLRPGLQQMMVQGAPCSGIACVLCFDLFRDRLFFVLT